MTKDQLRRAVPITHLQMQIVVAFDSVCIRNATHRHIPTRIHANTWSAAMTRICAFIVPDPVCVYFARVSLCLFSLYMLSWVLRAAPNSDLHSTQN